MENRLFLPLLKSKALRRGIIGGDDIVCLDGVPTMFLFDGGYADIKGTALTWHYYVTDHLGSKRIVQDEQGKVEATYN